MRPTTLISIFAVAALGQAARAATLEDFAIYSHGAVSIDQKSDIDAFVAGMGPIQIDKQSTISGDIFSQGSILLGNQVTAGTLYPDLSPGAFPGAGLPSIDLSSAGADAITINDHATLALAPGTYGALTAGHRSQLTLTAGTYYFDSFDFGSQAELTLDTSAGDVRVNVAGGAFFDMKAAIERTAAHGALFTVAGSVQFDQQVVFDSSLLAGGAVTIGQKADIAGQLFAHGSISLGQQSHVGGVTLGSLGGGLAPEPGTLTALGLLAWCTRHRRTRA
jgi:hypothetical protein